MKITILDTIPGEEDEIIIKCQNLSEDIQNLLQKLKQGNTKIAGYNENGIHLLEPDEVYYFETVDNKVFACCKKEVYEVREKLYTLEVLDNGEKTIISRQYVPVLKERLGL